MQGEKPQEQPPLLECDQLGFWQGEITSTEGDPVLVRMDDVTFQQHLNAYLLTRYKEPAPEDRQVAFATLRSVQYWLNIKVPDKRVQIRRFGRKCSPEEECYAQ